MRQRDRDPPCSHETGEVRHVHHEVRADFISDRAELREVDRARIGGTARDDDLRLGCSFATFRTSSKSIRPSCSRTPYWCALNHLPDWLTDAPCVRCPPASRLMPRMLSPGLISALNTALVRLASRDGCTLANSQPNSAFARSIASVSTIVHELAAAIVALARIPFRILVRQQRTLQLPAPRAKRCSRRRSARSDGSAGRVPRRSTSRLLGPLHQGRPRRTPWCVHPQGHSTGSCVRLQAFRGGFQRRYGLPAALASVAAKRVKWR
jgi:hypothetical protein